MSLGHGRGISHAAIARLSRGLGVIALVWSGVPAAAGTRYIAQPIVTPQATTGVAPKGSALATYILAPALTVELLGTLNPQIALSAAVTAGAPFVPGRMLYGGEDRPGLYCDVMRNRGLGSSTACLRDSDQDGRFDQAVRYDFNSGRSDMVFITDKGKVRGGKLKATIPLQEPIAYRAVSAAATPTATVKLMWNARNIKGQDGVKHPQVELVATDGSNFTGTEILSEQYALVPLGGQPRTLSFYGLNLTLRGLTADRGLAYSVEQIQPTIPIEFVFRGYILRIIGY